MVFVGHDLHLPFLRAIGVVCNSTCSAAEYKLQAIETIELYRFPTTSEEIQVACVKVNGTRSLNRTVANTEVVNPINFREQKLILQVIVQKCIGTFVL